MSVASTGPNERARGRPTAALPAFRRPFRSSSAPADKNAVHRGGG